MKKRRVGLAAVTLLGLMTSAGGARAEVFSLAFGTAGSGPGQFQEPTGVAVDGTGNVYVADRVNRRVQKFGPSGDFVLEFGGFRAEAVAADGNGNVYATDPENRRVLKFGPAGNLLDEIPAFSTRTQESYVPDGVAVDALDNVYVIGPSHLQKFDAAGNPLLEFPLGGIVPTAIAVDSAGNIVIWENDNGSVNKYDAAGTLTLMFGVTASDTACDVASGFQCVDPDGPTGPLEAGDGQFSYGDKRGVAVDASGNIYVTDRRNARVQKFSPSGQFLLKFGAAGAGDGQFGTAFYGVMGIAVNRLGRIYVADTDNNRIQVFDSGARRSVDSATGAGSVAFTTSAGEFASLMAVPEGSLPAAGKPAGVTFPFGFFDWTVTGLTPGQTITVTMTYPANVASPARYWKVIGASWIDATSLLDSDDGDNVLTLTITDGGAGDADGVANGQISDPGGVAIVLSQPAEVPFATFAAAVQIALAPGPRDDRFAVEAFVRLGAGTDGFDPVTEPVTLGLGTSRWTIPPGSFQRTRYGGFVFRGTVDATQLAVAIQPFRDGAIGVAAGGAAAALTGTVNPVAVSLTLGDDAGTATAVARFFGKTAP